MNRLEGAGLSGLIPAPFIQNHVNWCWATVAKIVGLAYLKSQNKALSNELIYYKQAVWPDIIGLRWEYIENVNGQVFVDYLQYCIVKSARSEIFNSDGFQAEGDTGKECALKYVVSGDCYSKNVEVVTLGKFNDRKSIIELYTNDITYAFTKGRYFIGNYIPIGKSSAHSVVLIPTNDGIKLYDPWNGLVGYYSLTDIFERGFYASRGFGIIKWIQFIV